MSASMTSRALWLAVWIQSHLWRAHRDGGVRGARDRDGSPKGRDSERGSVREHDSPARQGSPQSEAVRRG